MMVEGVGVCMKTGAWARRNPYIDMDAVNGAAACRCCSPSERRRYALQTPPSFS